jgi:hypothetical protein
MAILKDILDRIELRLKETGQNPTAASKDAGKPDAIRNIQRSVEKGEQGSVKLETLLALAEQLDTDPKWLIFGGDKPESGPSLNDNALKPYLDAFHSVLVMIVKDREEADALLNIALLSAQEPPVPSSGPDHHKVLAEIGVRKFLKSKQDQQDEA